jgi:hypothetical protein
LKKDKCIGCYRWDEIENRCSGWTDLDTNCSPVYEPNKYMVELTTMLNYLSMTATRTAYTRLKKQIDYLIKNLENNMKKDWASAMNEDMQRGTRGGGGEQSGNSAGIKQRMKDNRDLDCKLNKIEKEKVTQAYKEFEEQHGKLDKISTKSTVSHNDIDTYTGERLKKVIVRRKGKKYNIIKKNK